MSQPPRDFEEFWPYYMSQHADPTCRRFHVVGTSLALACVALSPLRPSLLIAAPIVGYGAAWIGHFAFEKNKPASWHSPKFFAWSFRGDMRLLRYTLTGRIDGELQRLAAVSARDGAGAAAE